MALHRIFSSLCASIVASASLLGVAPARAASPPIPSPELNALVDASGTGSLVKEALTAQIRSAVPATPASTGPRILIIGTGVKADLFPADLKARVAPSGPQGTGPPSHRYR